MPVHELHVPFRIGRDDPVRDRPEGDLRPLLLPGKLAEGPAQRHHREVPQDQIDDDADEVAEQEKEARPQYQWPEGAADLDGADGPAGFQDRLGPEEGGPGNGFDRRRDLVSAAVEDAPGIALALPQALFEHSHDPDGLELPHVGVRDDDPVHFPRVRLRFHLQGRPHGLVADGEMDGRQPQGRHDRDDPGKAPDDTRQVPVLRFHGPAHLHPEPGSRIHGSGTWPTRERMAFPPGDRTKRTNFPAAGEGVWRVTMKNVFV